MKKIGLILMAAASINVFASCDDDRRHWDYAMSSGVSALTMQTFYEMFSDAVNTEWELKGTYAVAEFYSSVGKWGDDDNTKAWFDNTSGDWVMTEINIAQSALPEAVLSAFSQSDYASWHIDDIDLVLRNGMEVVYVLEVELGELDIDLYYSADGILVKSVSGQAADYDYYDFLPQQATGSVADWISAQYPDARIVDIDIESYGTEVEILDGTWLRELLFDTSGAWVYTKTEISWLQLPSAVSQAFQSSEYSGYHIDDIDFYQTESAEFYRFDLESAYGDVKIDITASGEVSLASSVIGSGSDTGTTTPSVPGNVSSDYASFIQSTYPGATIIEQDYDDGFLEIEIWHDNREKKVYFDATGSWVFTETDYTYWELPDAVKSAITSSQYGNYKVDDIEYVESPSGSWFLVELEGAGRDVHLRIDANGNIL